MKKNLIRLTVDETLNLKSKRRIILKPLMQNKDGLPRWSNDSSNHDLQTSSELFHNDCDDDREIFLADYQARS